MGAAVTFLAVSARASGVAAAKDYNGSAPKYGGGDLRLNPEELKVFNCTTRSATKKGSNFLACIRSTRAARAHSRDMLRRDYFSHDSADGRTFNDRIKAPGYTLEGYRYMKIGENIAWISGYLSIPETAMRNWLNSPGHKRNILDPAYRAVGVGEYSGS